MRSTGDFISGYKPRGLNPTLIDRGGEVLSMYGFGPRIMNGITEGAKAMNYSISISSQAYRLAELEGLVGADFSKMVASLKLEPTLEMAIEANKFAKSQTLTSDLIGHYEAAEFLMKKVPPLRLVLPFIKVSLNELDQEIQRIPLAGAISPQLRADWAAGGIKRDEILSKWAVGTSTAYLVCGLVGKGLITGRAPANPGMRKIWDLQNVKVRIA